ncbi:Uncharacterized protein APZ42_016733 [Daphnia magna]|uniref:Uncharacterized protein n=1 Tax=Daphnia magna TaxID=35525 RepID=A0A165A4A3_9CRUS|nr:Uncharacterized protein APZ42_016733 [Daphnia magna]
MARVCRHTENGSDFAGLTFSAAQFSWREQYDEYPMAIVCHSQQLLVACCRLSSSSAFLSSFPSSTYLYAPLPLLERPRFCFSLPTDTEEKDKETQYDGNYINASFVPRIPFPFCASLFTACCASPSAVKQRELSKR